jgi:hypothetical protein
MISGDTDESEDDDIQTVQVWAKTGFHVNFYKREPEPVFMQENTKLLQNWFSGLNKKGGAKWVFMYENAIGIITDFDV